MDLYISDWRTLEKENIPSLSYILAYKLEDFLDILEYKNKLLVRWFLYIDCLVHMEMDYKDS